jgi:hypothetical protein
MLKNDPHEKTETPQPEQALDPLSKPSAATVEPWLDRTLPAEARLESYRSVIKAEGHDLLGRVEDKALSDEEFNRLENAPETQRIMRELEWLKTVTPTDFCEEMERRCEQIPRELLDKNFLGAEAWRKQGIDVGEEPPLPASITEELLHSECPLHPGEKIKDTHLLVLIPKTVNGEPYTALKLDELCATRKGSGDTLICDGWISWKEQLWASQQRLESEWVLIPKSDPDPEKVPADKHFRSKNIAAQQNVHDEHYGEYREVKTVELMTAVLLHDLVNGDPRMLAGWNYLRCLEPNASGGRVCVGNFHASGLKVDVGHVRRGHDDIGRALARK